LQRRDKNLGIYLGLVFTVWIFVIIFINYSLENPIFSVTTTKIEFTRVLNVDKLALFETMADIRNYPIILPNNFISVTIINETHNRAPGPGQSAVTIFAKETISERGITTDIIARHELYPPNRHIVEIVSGDAKNTRIILNLDELDSSTILSTQIEMKLRGVLIPFGFLPSDQFESAFSTVISGFVDYTNQKLED